MAKEKQREHKPRPLLFVCLFLFFKLEPKWMKISQIPSDFKRFCCSPNFFVVV